MSRIPFLDYMHHCLYDPHTGYYESNRLGQDFFTTPMRTDALAYALYKRVRVALQEHASITYVEIGPGRLQLAQAMLHYLDQDKRVSRIVLLEKSAALRAWQKEHIARHWPKTWQELVTVQEDIDEMIPHGFCVAHEVLDALPVSLLQYYQGTWFNMLVDTKASVPCLVRGDPHHRPPTPWLDEAYRDGATYEISPFLPDWLRHIVRYMPGALMAWMDYGDDAFHIYHPERPLGTLRAYYDHAIVPWYTKGADITADVNWSLVGELFAPYAHTITLEYQADIMLEALPDFEALGIDIQSMHRVFFDPTQMAKRIQMMLVQLKENFSE